MTDCQLAVKNDFELIFNDSLNITYTHRNLIQEKFKNQIEKEWIFLKKHVIKIDNYW